MIYLPFVDGLRAIAILAVVAYHALPALLPGGFVGVDVFFVISGFLITRQIADEIATRTFSLSHFFLRRLRRLAPAALVCLAVVTVVAAIILLPYAFRDYGRSLLASSMMYANVYFYLTSDYFSAPSLEKPLLHIWSLAVEDQFYLTWPLLLMLLIPRVRSSTVIVTSVLLIAASLALCEFLLPRSQEFVFYMLPTRAWELLTGAVLALAASRIRLPRVAAEVVALAGVGAIAASFFLLNSGKTFPGVAAAPAVFGTAAVIVAGLSARTVVSALLSLPPVVFVGLVSYSFYLWHWPLIALSSYRLERVLTTSEALGVITVSFAVACLSWQFVERTFRLRPHASGAFAWQRGDVKFAASGVGVAVLLALTGAGISIAKGVPSRIDDTVQPLLDQMISGNPWRRKCDDFQNIFRNDDVCNFGRRKGAGESYEVAVFGDSMADHWVPLVAGYAKSMSLAGRQVTNGGCALLFGTVIPASPPAKALECANYQREARNWLDANPGLKLAVISGYWNKWMRLVGNDAAHELSDGDWKTAAAPATNADFDAAMRETIGVFTERGVKVLLVGQIPTYERLPIRCIVAAAYESADPGRCGATAEAAEEELSESDRALEKLVASNPAISIFLPSGPMCSQDRCPPVVKGVMLYKNEEHLNRFGAEYLRPFVRFPELSSRGVVPP